MGHVGSQRNGSWDWEINGSGLVQGHGSSGSVVAVRRSEKSCTFRGPLLRNIVFLFRSSVRIYSN